MKQKKQLTETKQAYCNCFYYQASLLQFFFQRLKEGCEYGGRARDSEL